ncbi:MAG: hypothetical protein ACK518_00735 [bacterium]|jgi:hypothetical protein
MELTIEQELNIQIIDRGLKNLSRHELETYIIELCRQNYAIHNGYREFLHKDLDISPIPPLK